jgi:hypothetical protein
MSPCLGSPRGRAAHQSCLMKEGAHPDGRATVRLSSCLEASGVQAAPRNARIDFEGVGHVVPNIGPSAVPGIATKEHTPPTMRSTSGRERKLSSAAISSAFRFDQILKVTHRRSVKPSTRLESASSGVVRKRQGREGP